MALTNMELEVHCPYCINAYGFRQMILNTEENTCAPLVVMWLFAETITLRALAHVAAP